MSERKPPSAPPARAPASSPVSSPSMRRPNAHVRDQVRGDARTVSNEAARALRDNLHQFHAPATNPTSMPPGVKLDGKTMLAKKKRSEALLAAARQIKLHVPGDAVTDRDVANRVVELQRLLATIIPISGSTVLQMGDDVEVDVTGYVGGRVAIAQAATWCTIAANPFLPGVFESLCGMTVPNTAVIELVLPAVYPAVELRGKVAGLVVQVKRAQRLRLPRVDDANFLQRTDRGVKTAAELHAKVRAEVVQERGRMMVIHAQLMFMRELYTRVGLDDAVDDNLVEDELKRRFAAKQGMAMQRLAVPLDEQRRAMVEFCTDAMRAEACRTVWEQQALEDFADGQQIVVADRDVTEVLRAVLPEMSAATMKHMINDGPIEDAKAAYRLKRALYTLLGCADISFGGPATGPLLTSLKKGSGGNAPSGMPAPDPVTATRGLRRPPSKGPSS
jgi:hypothetical protein